MSLAYRHRVLTGWINDISRVKRTGKRWPIIDLDDSLLQDYRHLFGEMNKWGYDEIVIWGLFINHSWSLDVSRSIEAGRDRAIRMLLDEAHRMNIRVMSGLGVYSWGFEEIIKHCPDTSRQEGRFVYGQFSSENRVVMCLHSEAAREWQRKIIDYHLGFDLDGYQMQIADQGRCACAQCRQLSDNEYYALLANETSAYIRSRKPDALIALSGWGVDLNRPEDMQHYRTMSEHLDYMTELSDKTGEEERRLRRTIAGEIDCDYGSCGGMVVVPPQRWERHRYFLPHVRFTADHIHMVAEDGGSAYEFFTGPLVNPGYEIMLKVTGLLLDQPDRQYEEVLGMVVDGIFEPKHTAAGLEIVELLTLAESNYFGKTDPVSGEFDFEPLMGEEAGPPIYLHRLSVDSLAHFRQDTERLRDRFSRMSPFVHRSEIIECIVRCLNNSLQDILQVLNHRK